MAPKTKKGTTMSLADFLQTETVNESWAEEPFQLPTAPRAMTSDPVLPSGPAGTFGNSSDSYDRRRPGRFSEQARVPAMVDQSRLPVAPPFTAFIGNLPFDISEADLRTFFQMRDIASNAIVNISLPRDHENKARGFGYVEFASVDDLTRALMASNQHQIRNRVVRIDFSEAKQRPERELRPAEASNNWRDGATSVSAGGFGAREVREVREPRPVSVAESNMNWRDGARNITPAATPSQVAPKARVSHEPMPNWRESAHPVEATAVPAPAKVEFKPKPAPVESKAPSAGSWRRQ